MQSEDFEWYVVVDNLRCDEAFRIDGVLSLCIGCATNSRLGYGRKMQNKIIGIVLVAVSVIYDFYRGYSHGKSIAEGSLYALLGLLFLACILLAFSRRKSN
jgi:hypothetical protein